MAFWLATESYKRFCCWWWCGVLTSVAACVLEAEIAWEVYVDGSFCRHDMVLSAAEGEGGEEGEGMEGVDGPVADAGVGDGDASLGG